MHPLTGLDLDEEAAHYMPEERLTTWEEYDEKIEVLFVYFNTLYFILNKILALKIFNPKISLNPKNYLTLNFS